MQTITNLNDPFTHKDLITYVASGKYVTPEIEKDLLYTEQICLQKVQTFAIDRLSTDGDICLNDPLPKPALKTFASFKAKPIKAKNIDAHQETRDVFARMMPVKEERSTVT